MHMSGRSGDRHLLKSSAAQIKSTQTTSLVNPVVFQRGQKQVGRKKRKEKNLFPRGV